MGEDGYIYRLEYSKTQQTGVKVDSTPDKPILGRSAEARAMWSVASVIGYFQAGAAEDNPAARLLK